jgi:hypothetical protein
MPHALSLADVEDGHYVVFSLLLTQPGFSVVGWPGRVAMGSIYVWDKVLEHGERAWLVYCTPSYDHAARTRRRDLEQQVQAVAPSPPDDARAMAAAFDQDGVLILSELTASGESLP